MNTQVGFVDLQVNGFAEVDFNADDVRAEEIHGVCRRLRGEGVAGILATVITADLPAMCRRLESICRMRERDALVAEIIWGIHIEGPFLNQEPGYIGAHPAAAALPADLDKLKRLLDAAGGLARIVTLAPEVDADSRMTRFLAGQNILVSAGHCNPTLDQLKASLDAGLSLFTHLGNGCPSLLPRHDNIIQRALSLSNRLHIGFIADGVHVPFPALGNYLKCCGLDRAFIVTDAICGAGLGPGEYTLGDRQVVIDENLATWAADRSHLVGSACTMQRAAANLEHALGLSTRQIQQLTSDNPRSLLGLSAP